MEAGRELDALIAERVMGTVEGYKEFYVYTDPGGMNVCMDPKFPRDGMAPERLTVETLPVYLDGSLDPDPYSTDIAAAWDVVEHLAPEWKMYLKTDFTKPREWAPGCTYYCAKYAKVTFLHFHDKRTVEAEAETVPHAICLAALKAVEGK